MSDKNWLMSMFDHKSGPDDVIDGTVLNITKWGAVFSAAIAAIAAGVEKVMGGKQFSPGNWTTIIVALFSLTTMLFVADMAARAYASAHSGTSPVFPEKPIEAKWQNPNEVGQGVAPHLGTIDGFRVSDGKAQVLAAERGGAASWVDFEQVLLDK